VAKALSRAIVLACIMLRVGTAHADTIQLQPSTLTVDFVIDTVGVSVGWGASLGVPALGFGSSTLAPVLSLEPMPALEYQPGEMVDLSRHFYTSGPQPATIVKGAVIEHVYFAADFLVSVPTTALQLVAPSNQWAVESAWSGTLVIARDANLSDVIFGGQFDALGVASMFFERPIEQRPLVLSQVVYSGARDAAPVPEPTSLLLLAPGVAALWVLRARRPCRAEPRD